MLFNALRMGFVVVPERLIDSFEAAKSFVDRHPPTLDQAILAEFINDGHFGHHVRKMREIYFERSSVLKTAATKHLDGVMELVDAEAGMRTIGWLLNRTPDRVAAQRARQLGLEITALSAFTVRHSQKPGLILGFAGCSPSELRRGVSVLATSFRRDS
jgi:GntR family transcriptional regulator/MocR family aminotransferase